MCCALKRSNRLLPVAERRRHCFDEVVARAVLKVNSETMCATMSIAAGRVLRLVDQHMVDAAVELVMHAARGDAVEHRQRLVDQIVIVEQAAFLFFTPVIGRRRRCDIEQRLGAVACD